MTVIVYDDRRDTSLQGLAGGGGDRSRQAGSVTQTGGQSAERRPQAGTGRQAVSQSGSKAARQQGSHAASQPARQTDRLILAKTDRYTGRQAGRQQDSRADRQVRARAKRHGGGWGCQPRALARC